MSDDLISRKAIYKAISDYLNRSRLGETSAQTDLRVGEIASIIHGVPTAFNKEKVIEELRNPDNYTIVAGKHFTTVDRSVEIVEKGGIDGQD